MRILIIEDDEHLRLTLKRGLESELFVVDHMPDGVNGSYIARTNTYNLILIDYILPGKDGLQITKDLREAGVTAPILIMSVKGEVDDKVKLLDAGADDYIVKPFTYSELLARIKALSRRDYRITESVITIDDLTIDSHANEVTCKGERKYFTRKEFQILHCLAKKKGEVVTRGELLEEVWDMEANPFSNTVEAHIRNIRRKLDPKNQDGYIRTISGRGYKMPNK